jgi:hypothetical protein
MGRALLTVPTRGPVGYIAELSVTTFWLYLRELSTASSIVRANREPGLPHRSGSDREGRSAGRIQMSDGSDASGRELWSRRPRHSRPGW